MPSASHEQLKSGILEILRQGELLLKSLDKAKYTQAVPEVFHSTIGGHYRHCLEHFEALLKVDGRELVDYDARKRNRELEEDPLQALSRTRALSRIFQMSMDDVFVVRKLSVRCQVVRGDAESPMVESSMAREAMYGIAHATHHFALIAVIAHRMGVELPEGFGMAPSTEQYRRNEIEAGAKAEHVHA